MKTASPFLVALLLGAALPVLAVEPAASGTTSAYVNGAASAKATADGAASGALPQQALPSACGAPLTADRLAKIVHKSPLLSRTEIEGLLAQPQQVVVIDVRRPDEVTVCGGFPVYLSIQIDQLEKALAFIPRDRKVVTVSNHAVRAWKSADLLAERGFNVVGAISAEDYAAAGGALVRIAPPARAVEPVSLRSTTLR